MKTKMWQSKKAGLFNNIPNCELKKAYSKCEAESRFKLTCQKSGKNALTYESADQINKVGEYIGHTAKKKRDRILRKHLEGFFLLMKRIRFIRTQAVRLVKTKPLNYTREDLMLITKTDLINAARELMC